MSERSPLLHSLHEFGPLILACLDAVAPRQILEIGSEAGAFTQDLCDWANRNGATVTAIEPIPLAVHREMVERDGLRLVVGKSPAVLPELGDFDVVVVDGDHNYWVVSQELGQVFAHGKPALAILHDVAWPCARRDQYYEPSDIPPEHRQPFSYDGGVVPDNSGLVDGGFRGEGAFAYARQEGGPGNGVLTAVEDFLAERRDLEFLRVPCIFGVGFVFPRRAPWASAVREIVSPLNENPLLATLEANRIDLFLRFIDPRGGAQRVDRATAGLISSLHREIEELQAEVARLRVEMSEPDSAATSA